MCSVYFVAARNGSMTRGCIRCPVNVRFPYPPACSSFNCNTSGCSAHCDDVTPGVLFLPLPRGVVTSSAADLCRAVCLTSCSRFPAYACSNENCTYMGGWGRGVANVPSTVLFCVMNCLKSRVNVVKLLLCDRTFIVFFCGFAPSNRVTIARRSNSPCGWFSV
jgi:hypothetical protein